MLSTFFLPLLISILHLFHTLTENSGFFAGRLGFGFLWNFIDLGVMFGLGCYSYVSGS